MPFVVSQCPFRTSGLKLIDYYHCEDQAQRPVDRLPLEVKTLAIVPDGRGLCAPASSQPFVSLQIAQYISLKSCRDCSVVTPGVLSSASRSEAHIPTSSGGSSLISSSARARMRTSACSEIAAALASIQCNRSLLQYCVWPCSRSCRKAVNRQQGVASLDSSDVDLGPSL